MINIFDYVTEENYKKACKTLNDSEMKNIYCDSEIEIDIKRIGKRVYKFISHYGEIDINKCITDMYVCRPISIGA